MHLPQRFWGLFAVLLLISGVTLCGWAIADSSGRQWKVMEVTVSELTAGAVKASLAAKADELYEVELVYPAPPTEAARTALADARRDRAAGDLGWSVHNPRGRVATGSDGDTLYVVRDHMKALGRLKSIMLASPFLPPLLTIPQWLASGPGDILVGIGQWRARSGQTYQMQASLQAGAKPDPEVRLRMRAQRLSWEDYVLTASARLYAGLLLIVAGVLVWLGRPRLTPRGQA